jgi:hypothetical protein
MIIKIHNEEYRNINDDIMKPHYIVDGETFHETTFI